MIERFSPLSIVNIFTPVDLQEHLSILLIHKFSYDPNETSCHKWSVITCVKYTDLKAIAHPHAISHSSFDNHTSFVELLDELRPMSAVDDRMTTFILTGTTVSSTLLSVLYPFFCTFCVNTYIVSPTDITDISPIFSSSMCDMRCTVLAVITCTEVTVLHYLYVSQQSFSQSQ